MPRKKSLQQIYAQADRIGDEAALRGWDGRRYSEQSQKRLDRIHEITTRYSKNVAKHFNRRDYVSNEQYVTPVSRRAYMGLAAG